MYKDIEKKLGIIIQEAKVLKSGWAGEIISIKPKNDVQRYIIKTYNSSKDGLQNIKREWTGLKILYEADYPVPKRITCDFTNDKPYIIMEEIEGQDLWTCYMNLANDEKEQLVDRFVKVFFDLHKLDISIICKEQVEECTSAFIEREINEIKRLVKDNDLEKLNPIIDWLDNEKVKVSSNKLSIIHRHYNPWNVIVHNTEKVYVIDLLWGIGDYRFNLAWTYTLMERSGFKDFSDKLLKRCTHLKNCEAKNSSHLKESEAKNSSHLKDCEAKNILHLKESEAKNVSQLKAEGIENFEYFKYFKVFSTLRWLVNVNISLSTGENLNEARKEEFENFISPLIQKGLMLIQEITEIQVGM